MSKIIVKVLDNVLIPRITYYEFNSKEEAIKAIREYDQSYYLPDENEVRMTLLQNEFDTYEWSDTDIYLDDEIVSAYNWEGNCNEWDDSILGERNDNS